MKLFSQVILVSSLLVSCDSNKERRGKFEDGLPHVFTEEKTGDKYLIEHTLGDNYSLRLWETNKGEQQ